MMGFDRISADTTFWVNIERVTDERRLWNARWMVNWWRYRGYVCQLGIIALSAKPRFVSISSVNILSLLRCVWLVGCFCNENVSFEKHSFPHVGNARNDDAACSKQTRQTPSSLWVFFEYELFSFALSVFPSWFASINDFRLKSHCFPSRSDIFD